MSWTCKRLTKKDIREVWFSGVFHKLYVSTREEIEAGKLMYILKKDGLMK